MKRFFVCSLTSIVLVVSGCSSELNEGALHLGTVPAAQAINGGTVKTNGAIFFPASTLQTSADVIQGERTVGGSKLEADNVSITLLSAFICDFREGGILAGSFDATNRDSEVCPGGLKTSTSGQILSSQDPATRGEIAILADYTERDGSNEVARDSASIYNFGRVIYYNEDIRETGQLLNDINIPIHGPIKYKKGATQLRLAIIEFDEDENERTKQIVQTLARIGGAAYPPAVPVLGVLTNLGNSVLNANKNDVEFRGEVTFDAPSKLSSLHRNPLQEGYYVFMREENRSKDFKWSKIEVCPEFGRVMYDNCTKTYRNQTWLLVRVSREDADVALAQNAGQAIAEFVKANAEFRTKNKAATEADLEALTKSIGGLFDEAGKS